MFLKANRRKKDGKDHVYYTLNESIRISRKQTVQRTVFYLGELNTTQLERWQKTVEAVTESGERRQLRLFSDREGKAPQAEDVVEVKLSSLSLCRPREFGPCWLGTKLWELLGLDCFWKEQFKEEAGHVAWEKVVEVLTINRLVEPRSELYLHEKWFPRVAIDFLLDTDARVAEKDRLYRCLDRMVSHKEALEKYLEQRWRTLFGADFQILLYDLTSTYFEGEAIEVAEAARGYSRDHRPDCLQIVIALVVNTEGLPIAYEVFDGNTVDVTTLQEVIEQIETKYGRQQRVWVFDRGIVSEENLEILRQKGSHYLVGTRRKELSRYEQRLVEGPWEKVSEEVQVQLIAEEGETYVLARSQSRSHKESAMRLRVLKKAMRSLIKLRRQIRLGKIKSRDKILFRLGQMGSRYSKVWFYLEWELNDRKLQWRWNREKLKHAQYRDGAYLLRSNLTAENPQSLWKKYIQLTEVEAVFRALKSELSVRPIWHWKSHRVHAHVMVAFLGYALWVVLKQKLKHSAAGLTPWQALETFKSMQLVEVWFETREDKKLCLQRITQPSEAQNLLLHELGWTLPAQPPPKIYEAQL
jgi:transposase